MHMSQSTVQIPLDVTYAAIDHTAPTHAPAPAYLPTSASYPQAGMYPNVFPQPTPFHPSSIPHMHPSLSEPLQRPPSRALTNPGLPPAAYGGFMQTHQGKNVQVFTGNADSKILVEDWVCDMQYLLEAVELPMHLRLSTVVRHLSGEARKLVLNLHPND